MLLLLFCHDFIFLIHTFNIAPSAFLVIHPFTFACKSVFLQYLVLLTQWDKADTWLVLDWVDADAQGGSVLIACRWQRGIKNECLGLFNWHNPSNDDLLSSPFLSHTHTYLTRPLVLSLMSAVNMTLKYELRAQSATLWQRSTWPEEHCRAMSVNRSSE